MSMKTSNHAQPDPIKFVRHLRIIWFVYNVLDYNGFYILTEIDFLLEVAKCCCFWHYDNCDKLFGILFSLILRSGELLEASKHKYEDILHIILQILWTHNYTATHTHTLQ